MLQFIQSMFIGLLPGTMFLQNAGALMVNKIDLVHLPVEFGCQAAENDCIIIFVASITNHYKSSSLNYRIHLL